MKNKIHKLFIPIDHNQKHAGMVWYELANIEARKIAKKYSLSMEQSAGILAVLSPGTKWSMNVRDAHNICKHGIKASVTSYGVNKRKALAILQENALDQIKGSKVKSFYANISDPSGNEVTLDRWMVRALDIDIKELAKPKKYEYICNEFRHVAGQLGIQPCQLQAAIWLDVRNSKQGMLFY